MLKNHLKFHWPRATSGAAVIAAVALFSMLPALDLAGETVGANGTDLTGHFIGYASLGIFVLAYIVVTCEEFTQLRRSKPVIIAAGLIWALVAWVTAGSSAAPAVVAGHVASIAAHMWVNSANPEWYIKNRS